MILRRLGLLCAMLAMFCIAGGHWTVLQTVAWAEMLHDYAQRNGSLMAAIQQTFDGQHPCALCRQLQAAKSSEKKNPASADLKDAAKTKARLADTIFVPGDRTAARVNYPRVTWAFVPGRAERPPTPPPRRGNVAA